MEMYFLDNDVFFPQLGDESWACFHASSKQFRVYDYRNCMKLITIIEVLQSGREVPFQGMRHKFMAFFLLVSQSGGRAGGKGGQSTHANAVSGPITQVRRFQYNCVLRTSALAN